jgi:putative tryptophan/tyrosine transport system substrate-binding protein
VCFEGHAAARVHQAPGRRSNSVFGLVARGIRPAANDESISDRVFGFAQADSLPKRPEAFRAGLRELGYREGRDFVIEYRWADGNYDQLPVLLNDLIRLKVDVIVTHGTPGVLAAKRATTTIPIVCAVVGDALASGVVSSLARPGGNVTGLTFFNPELAAKRLELLKEVLPDLTDVGILLNSANPINDPILPQMSSIARPLKLELHQFDARSPADFEAAFTAMVARRVGALVVIEDAMLISNASTVAALALKQRLPSCGWPDYAIGGGVMGYGVDFPDMFRHAATFVDKIIKGAKPGDLPFERATKFEIMVNLKTAKTLGLTIPYNLLVRANEVIE